MNRFRISLAAVGLIAASFCCLATARSAHAQTGGLQCFCVPDITLIDDSSCVTCPTMTLSNLVERLGKCAAGGGSCSGASTRTCRVTGTATEQGCSGFVDVPFVVEAACNQSSTWDAEDFECTSDGFYHFIFLECKACAP